MKVAVIGGVLDSKSFLIAVHVAILGRQKFPAFQYRTQPVDKHDYLKWLRSLCEEEKWCLADLEKERVVCWYEIGSGGPRRLLGGLYQFLEYMYHNFGVQRQLTLDQLETILRLRIKQRKADVDYEDKMRKLKSTLTVSIVGAGSNSAARMIVYGLLRLKGRQLQDGIYIRLYDKHESKQETLKMIQKELNYVDNRQGSGFISIVTDFKQLVQGCDLLVFLGENFRTGGMDVEDLLQRERVLYSVYGVLCNRYVEYSTKIVMCCMENSCFNATAFMERVKGLCPGRVVAVTSHLPAQIKPYLSKVAGFPMENIVDIPVWGMAEMCHVVQPSKGKILFRCPDTKSDWFPNYEAYMEKCGPAMKLLCRMMERKRQEKRDPERARKEREEVSTVLVDWAHRLRKEAQKGDNEAAVLLQRVKEQLADILDGGQVDLALSLRSLIEGSIVLYDKKWVKPGDEDSSKDLTVKEKVREYVHRKDINGEGFGEEGEGPLIGSANEANVDNSGSKDKLGCKATKDALRRLSSEEFKRKCLEGGHSSEDEGFHDEGASSEVKEERYEMRRLGYITEAMRNMWNFVGVAKERVRQINGQSPFVAEIHQLTELLKVWFLDPCRKNQILYLGILSDGSYGFPAGYVMSQPARLDENHCWQPYLDVEIVQPTPAGPNPHQDPPRRLPSHIPQHYSLPAMISIARTTLKHFNIYPESETDEDIVAKRVLQKNIIKWKLEKLQADYEYRELKILNLNDSAKDEVKPFWDMMEEAVEGRSDIFHGSPGVPEDLGEEGEMASEGRGRGWEGEGREEEWWGEAEGGDEGMRRSSEDKKEEAKESGVRDKTHTDYLTSLGFYDVSSDEETAEQDHLDPHLQQLITDGKLIIKQASIVRKGTFFK